MSALLQEGDDFYYNEEGLFVFTAAWHLKKGVCCGNGCIHCPFDYKAVPLDKKQVLVEASSSNNRQACS